jgi:polygalacturonase
MAFITTTLRLVLSFLLYTLVAAQSRTKTCTVVSSNGASDDSPAFDAALKSCSSNAIIEFKKGVTYNIWTPISAKLTNVEIRVNGNLHLPNSIETVQDIVGEGKSRWFSFSGSKVDWIGSTDERFGWIDSFGQQWYDANPPGKTGLSGRPHLFRWAVNNGSLRRFKSRKPTGWNVGISGNDNIVTDAIIDAVSDSSRFSFNTDAFGVSGRNVRISNAYIMNGDDAIAIGNGARDFVFENSVIGWETHGMSIGSLGSNPNQAVAVSNILFRNITVKGGLYAARFKSWKGGQGLVKNVTWSDIRVQNVTFPIFVTQTYTNQALGRSQPSRPSGQAVQMQDFTWEKFEGTINSQNPGDGSCVKPCWYNDGLKGLRHTEALVIGCDNGSSCRNFVFKGINLKPTGGGAATQMCVNLNSNSSPLLGIQCHNDVFAMTGR